MKKYMVVLTAVVMVVVMVGGAYAAGSTPITVNATATVTAACQFGGTPALDFGSFDATAGVVAALPTQPTLWCTNGYTATVVDNGGQNGVVGTSWNLHNGTNLIPYTLTYTKNPVGAGKGTTNLMTIGGTIAAGAANAAPAGVYTDAVILTINY